MDGEQSTWLEWAGYFCIWMTLLAGLALIGTAIFIALKNRQDFSPGNSVSLALLGVVLLVIVFPFELTYSHGDTAIEKPGYLPPSPVLVSAQEQAGEKAGVDVDRAAAHDTLGLTGGSGFFSRLMSKEHIVSPVDGPVPDHSALIFYVDARKGLARHIERLLVTRFRTSAVNTDLSESRSFPEGTVRIIYAKGQEEQAQFIFDIIREETPESKLPADQLRIDPYPLHLRKGDVQILLY